MAKVLGMPLTKARNWTIGRPLGIPASVRTATGTGTRNLYSIEDVYLMVWFAKNTSGPVVMRRRVHNGCEDPRVLGSGQSVQR